MEKIRITPLKRGNPQIDQAIEVLFNPASYTVSKTVAYTPMESGGARRLNAPRLKFSGGGSRTLTLDLFYDVTEPVSIGGLPMPVGDVREQTNRIVALTRLSAQGRAPPVLEVSWGDAGPAHSDFPFQGVITSLTQTFTMFEESGVPLRATLGISFLEFDGSAPASTSSSAGTVTGMVRAGDRLEGLAGVHFNDPARWRAIAKANGIDDPRRLAIGRRLSVPKP
jgi:hypothetical protein